jgi:hypothetical protein
MSAVAVRMSLVGLLAGYVLYRTAKAVVWPFIVAYREARG